MKSLLIVALCFRYIRDEVNFSMVFYLEASEEELEVAAEIRQRVLQHIDTRNIEIQDVAAVLDMLPSGASDFIRTDPWTIEQAFRAAAAFELPAVRKSYRGARAAKHKDD